MNVLRSLKKWIIFYLNHYKVINCSSKIDCYICNKKFHITYRHIEKTVDDGCMHDGHCEKHNHEHKPFRY